MRRNRKLLMASLACAGIVMALLLTALLTTHLLANRDVVKAFIISRTAQATGGALVYDRLDISFFPLPHLTARDIHLNRPDTFNVTARELAVYPRILPLLIGRVSIRRLALAAPGVAVLMGSYPMKTSGLPKENGGGSLEAGIKTRIGSLFAALAAIDAGTDLQIEEGTLTLAYPDAPDFRMTGIDAAVVNADGDLSLILRCQSELAGTLDFSAKADIQAMQASGEIALSDINLRRLLFHAALPGGISTEDTRAAIKASFSVDGSETAHGRFQFQVPSLTIMRKGLKLDLDSVAVSGSVGYTDKKLTVSIDSLKSAHPALELSAAATLKPIGDAGRSAIEVNAAASELDVAVAAAVTRAIAGDLDAIRTAFSVAKEGRLTDAAYFAGFDIDETGWHLNKMKAEGHLSQGLVTIPGIEADIERMNGDILYEDKKVAFKHVSGHFKGATFKELDAAIDWETESTLAISSRSVTVDAAPLHNWLTAFEGLSGVNNYIGSVAGSGRLSKLQIDGPLTQPENWRFDISGTPEDIRLTSPLVPFAVNLSGGEIDYLPGDERAKNVRIEFLDGSFVSSYQSKGVINPESIAFQIDGSMGEATIDWLSTILPIPKHLQFKPPVDLSGVNIVWSNTGTRAFVGEIRTAGDVDLFADLRVSPQDWQIRRIAFTDGNSQATASARKQADGMEVSFSGNVEKSTADRILENNQILSGRLEGDFRAVVNTRVPLNSSFTGHLSGNGLHILSLVSEPINVKRFSITGSDGQMKIGPSEVSLGNSLLMVDGVLNTSDGSLTVDLNVDADRLDEQLLRALQPIDNNKADMTEKIDSASAVAARGVVHVKAADVTYGGFTWSPVRADIHVDGDRIQVQIDQADLCGISTTGVLGFSPQGTSLRITPTAAGASLQKTALCLWNRPVKTAAAFDLFGEISLPPTREDPARFLSGQMEFSSENGRIEYAGVLMKIFSVLNITEIFTGGKTDLAEAGYGYTKAYAKAQIGKGKLQLNEILMDGNALKLTGQGTIFLDTRQAEITLLAAPLKTIDRIVNKIPIINYIAGGALISIPLRIWGPLNDLKVTPMSPSAVGEGVLHIMERTLKAPFKLVQSASEFVEEESSKATPPLKDSKADGP